MLSTLSSYGLIDVQHGYIQAMSKDLPKHSIVLTAKATSSWLWISAMLPQSDIARFRLRLPIRYHRRLHSMWFYWRQKLATACGTCPSETPKAFSAGTFSAYSVGLAISRLHGIKRMPLVTAFFSISGPLCPSEGISFVHSDNPRLTFYQAFSRTNWSLFYCFEKNFRGKVRTLSANPRTSFSRCFGIWSASTTQIISVSSDCFSDSLALQLCYLLGQCFLSATSFSINARISHLLQNTLFTSALIFPLLQPLNA